MEDIVGWYPLDRRSRRFSPRALSALRPTLSTRDSSAASTASNDVALDIYESCVHRTHICFGFHSRRGVSATKLFAAQINFLLSSSSNLKSISNRNDRRLSSNYWTFFSIRLLSKYCANYGAGNVTSKSRCIHRWPPIRGPAFFSRSAPEKCAARVLGDDTLCSWRRCSGSRDLQRLV